MKEPRIKRRDEGGETGQESQETEGRGKAGRAFKLTIGQGSDGHLI